MNSVIHGFENIEKGQIDICAELITTNKLKIVYRDNGIGIPSDIRKRIFDPFVTTKRGQGVWIRHALSVQFSHSSAQWLYLNYQRSR